MVELIPTALAVFALVLFGVAILSMMAGDFGIAGVTFLGASVVIYLRETRLQEQ